MSDFLTRLAQRAQGAAQMISPRLPSRYAPLTETVSDTHETNAGSFVASSLARLLAEETNGSHSPVDAGPNRERQTPPAMGQLPSLLQQDTGSRDDRQDNPQNHELLLQTLFGASLTGEEEPREATAADARKVALVKRSFAQPPQSKSSHALRRETQQRAPRAALTDDSRTTQEADYRSAGARATDPVVKLPVPHAGEELADRERWQPLVPKFKPQTPGEVFTSQRQPASANAAPMVHISIGRVEVRAHTGKATAAAPPPPRAGRKPSLSLADYLKRGGGRS